MGGDWLKRSRSVTSGLLVRHPRATFLFEGGVGSRIQGEFERNFNGWQKALFAHVYERPLLEQLQSAGIDPATIDFLLLTHLHRDHAGVTCEAFSIDAAASIGGSNRFDRCVRNSRPVQATSRWIKAGSATPVAGNPFDDWYSATRLMLVCPRTPSARMSAPRSESPS